MKVRKNVLTVAVLSFLLSNTALAETDGWGAVAAESESGAWGASTEVSEPEPAKQVKAVSAEPGKLACGEDDPRYARIVPVLKAIQAGEPIEPLQTSLETYMTLNNKVRTLLGDNIYISSPDCSEQPLFDGELTGKINVPFNDIWRSINDSLRSNNQEALLFVVNNTRATPESTLGIVSMAQPVHLDDEQLRKLFSVIAPHKAKEKELKKVTLLEIFLAFSGKIKEEEKGTKVFLGADPYGGLHEIHIEKNKGKLNTPSLKNDRNSPSRMAAMLRTTGLNPIVTGTISAGKLAAEE